MSHEKSNDNDLQDRLLDRALHEVVGGETPPDLSERILATRRKDAKQVVSLASNEQARGTLSSRALVASVVVAACLLVGAMLPSLQPFRNVAVRPQPRLLEKEPADVSWEARDESKSLKRSLTSSIVGQDKEEKKNGTGGLGAKDSVQVESLPALESPPVIHPELQVWEDLIKRRERFAKPTSSEGPSQPSRKLGLEGLIDEAGGSTLSKESSEKKVIPFYAMGSGQKKAARRGSGNVRPSRGGRGAGGYGGEIDGYGGEMGGYGGYAGPGQVESYARSAVKSGSPFNKQSDSQGAGLRGLHREVSRELEEKIAKYNHQAENLGSVEASTSNTVLNTMVNDVRKIQAEIIKAKEEMVEIAVNREISEQQARSPMALESAIAKELDKDPMIANYKSEVFTLLQQLRQGKATNGKTSGATIKRLEAQLKQVQQEASQYRQQTEIELRKSLRSAPNAARAVADADFRKRRAVLLKNIAELQERYEVSVAKIEQKSSSNSKLAILQAEIEQLRAAEKAMAQGLLERGMNPEEGTGPGTAGDQYTRIYENPFVEAVGERAVSTFSIDVDTASYANVRQFLMKAGQLPPPDAVRIEELVNYFDYDYSPPTGDTPFAAHVEVAGCPWHAGHRLVRVGIKGREMATDRRPQSNLVFLIDVSGSMNHEDKLPLLIEGMKLLARDLGENDRVAIVVYASSEGLALPSTRGDQKAAIFGALNKLRAGGSTAGGAGIKLAYQIAKDNFIEGGVNRVILATDGDFNVGVTSPGALEQLAETNAKETGVFLTVLGFGRGNLNDAMMEAISGKGNGNYHYVDNRSEAEKVLVAEMADTLVTIAKDVKIQIEFNPAQVAAYRLIGYENRMLETEDFNDDKKDAGEIGAGHTVTAIYEVVPAGQATEDPAVDPLKYQTPAKSKLTNDAGALEELLTLKLRYKQPDGDKSTKVEFPITDEGKAFAEATDDFKFASAVASFGMLLRSSEHRGTTSYSAVQEIAQDGTGKDKHGYRAEFLQLVHQAKALAGE